MPLSEKDKLKLVFSLSHRQRSPESVERLKLEVQTADGPQDISKVGGGLWYIEAKDIGGDLKEAIREAHLVTVVNDLGQMQRSQRFMQALLLMIREGALAEVRLPLKAEGQELTDALDLKSFHRDFRKGDLDSHLKAFDENVDPGMAAVVYAMVDRYYGLSGLTDIEEVVKEAGNSPEPPENTAATP